MTDYVQNLDALSLITAEAVCSILYYKFYVRAEAKG